MGKKIEEEKLREEKDKSNGSERNHLPVPLPNVPKIVVPFDMSQHLFSVNHVERKRFSSKGIKMDQKQIQ